MFVFILKWWGSSGTSSIALVALLGGVSYLLSQGIDIRPNLAAILGLAFLDSIFLGGACLALISSFWPPYGRRILVHDAGRLLVVYLMGCPVRGAILDPIAAMQMGIHGQAGTHFWDEKMSNELAEGRLSGSAFAGTAWCFSLVSQLKLWFMVRLRVRRMTKTCFAASVSFCNPHRL